MAGEALRTLGKAPSQQDLKVCGWQNNMEMGVCVGGGVCVVYCAYHLSVRVCLLIC